MVNRSPRFLHLYLLLFFCICFLYLLLSFVCDSSSLLFVCRSKLCEKALSTDKYVPDFCAKVVKSTQPCRLLQIQRSAYLAAKHAAAYELRVGKMSLKKSVKKLLEEGKQTKLIPGHDGEEPAGTHAHTQDGDGDDDDDPGEVGEDVALLGSGARRSEQAQRKSDVVIELM